LNEWISLNYFDDFKGSCSSYKQLAAVLKRNEVEDGKEWEVGASLTGHREFIQVASFSPLLFSINPKQPKNENEMKEEEEEKISNDNKQDQENKLLALGSLDGTISVWATTHNHCFLHLPSLGGSITDIRLFSFLFHYS